MGINIVIIHVVIVFISFLYYIPKRTDIYGDFYYESEFNENFPIFSKTGYWFFILLLIYIIVDHLWLNYFYFDSFEDSFFLIIIAVLALPIFGVLYKFYFEEIYFVSDKFKEKRKFVVESIFLYLYSVSVLISCALIYNANHYLDNSAPIEHKVKVLEARTYVTGSGKSRTRHYDLTVEPPICGLKIVEVPKENFRLCHKGINVKLYVGNGLFGQRYLTKKMELVK
jgi:hypothetical protein